MSYKRLTIPLLLQWSVGIKGLLLSLSPRSLVSFLSYTTNLAPSDAAIISTSIKLKAVNFCL